jgi:glyoxylase-like metal-dependent hydrolase (beta-lactamase superfamily II)
MEEVLDHIYLVDTLGYVEPGTISTYIVEFERVAIVDPGTVNGAKILIDELIKSGLDGKLRYVANTHIHIDHGAGSCVLAKNFNVEVIVHPKGVKHMVNPERLWESSKTVLGELAEVYGRPYPIDESKMVAAEDGQRFDLGGDTLISFHAPGHAPHMLAFYLERSKVLFPSDSVGLYFDGKVLPSTPPPFDMEKALKTLKRLMELDVRYVAFTHYGVAEGNEVLKKGYEKIVMWGELAEEVARTGGDVNVLLNKIMEADEDLKEIQSKFGDKPVAFSFLQVAAAGMLDYAKKKI